MQFRHGYYGGQICLKCINPHSTRPERVLKAALTAAMGHYDIHTH
jgi:hypothetical protein